MRQIDWPEFREHIAAARVALRYEQQDAYAQTPQEREHFAAFLRGELIDPTTVPNLARWYAKVAARPAGSRMERVRVHQDPPTDYQRWVRWIGQWNERAGEVMHYITPAQADVVGLDVAGSDDWWLLDDRTVLRLRFDTPGVATLHLIDEPRTVARMSAWWRLALRAAA